MAFFSEADWNANEAMNAELAALREDLAPAWLLPPLSLEETAERYIRPALRQHLHPAVPGHGARVPGALRLPVGPA